MRVHTLFLALYLSVVLPLPQSRTLLGAVAYSLSFSLTVFTLLFLFSLSFTLANRTFNSDSLLGPPIPPPFYFFLSLQRDCDGSQRPAQVCVTSDSICTDSDLGLMFVVTLWYNMRFPQGSASFSLAFFQSESPCWLCACVSLSLQLLVVWSIVYW